MPSEDSQILLVDDEPDNLQFLERVLREKYAVHAFTNAREALESIAGRRYSVIVSDHRMPEMSGVTFLAATMPLAPDALRILVTAFADLNVALDAVNRARVNAILCKPLDPNQLLREVERCDNFYRTIRRLKETVEGVARANEEIGRQLGQLQKKR